MFIEQTIPKIFSLRRSEICFHSAMRRLLRSYGARTYLRGFGYKHLAPLGRNPTPQIYKVLKQLPRSVKTSGDIHCCL